MFTEMIERVQTITISRLLKGRIVRVRPGMPMGRPAPAPAPAKPVAQQLPAENQAKPEAEAEEKPAEQPAQPAPEAKPANVQRVPMPGAGGLSMRPQEFTPDPTGKQNPFVRSKKKEVGRNDPCPCGSGKKYKDCCYWNDHK